MLEGSRTLEWVCFLQFPFTYCLTDMLRLKGSSLQTRYVSPVVHRVPQGAQAQQTDLQAVLTPKADPLGMSWALGVPSHLPLHGHSSCLSVTVSVSGLSTNPPRCHTKGQRHLDSSLRHCPPCLNFPITCPNAPLRVGLQNGRRSSRESFNGKQDAGIFWQSTNLS